MLINSLSRKNGSKEPELTTIIDCSASTSSLVVNTAWQFSHDLLRQTPPDFRWGREFITLVLPLQ
jgi:hypothetical protein